MDVQIIIAIVAASLSGITTYITMKNYKNPVVVYKISEISDFNLPFEFYKGISNLPVSITITNNGNKEAKNLKLELKTNLDIVGTPMYREDQLRIIENKNRILIVEGKKDFNPSENILISFNCEKTDDSTKKIVSQNNFHLTIANGKVLSNDDLIKQKQPKLFWGFFST